MNIQRIKHIILPLLLICLCGVVLFTACDSGENPSGNNEIFIASSDMPRAKYVLGQELDLKSGALTVVLNGEAGKVPMTADGVEVSGYNRDLLGKQTLTVTYQGMTATFEVEVLPRATAENFETDYFVGDSFDDSKGRLWINKDDGSSFQVAMDSEKLTLKSFDSSKAGKATVILEYKDTSMTCECSLEVNVHEIAEVVPTFPKNNDYVSHMTELNLKDAYLTVTAAAPSTFSKYVPMTQDMITGFHPEEVDASHSETPVTQTLTVSYGGYSFTFDVNIYYSPVYLMEDVAKQLKDLDFDGDTLPTITDEQGAAAANAIMVYLELAPSEQALLSKDDVLAVARPATVYLTKLYMDATAPYADAFEIYSNGGMGLVGKSYQAIEDAIERLQDPDDMFNYYAEQLNEIKKKFSSEFLVGTVPFGSYIVAHSEENVDAIVPLFRHMLRVYDALEMIPEQWTVADLKRYAEDIEVATDRILISDYLGMSNFYMYDSISSWRKADDYLEIIYTYYNNVKEGGKQEIRERIWNKMPPPGPLNDWYVGYIYARNEAQTMAQVQQSFLYDTAGFVYYYRMAENAANTVKNGNNQLYIDLYELMNCEAEFNNMLRYSTYGYVYVMGEALGHKDIDAAWDAYLTLVTGYLTDREFSLEKNAKDFEGAFNAMADLSPSELYSFLSTINFHYNTAKGAYLVLDCKQYVYNTMMSLVASYYYYTLGEDVMPCFIQLVNAMELCSQQNIKATAKEEFLATMKSLNQALTSLTKEQRTLFDKYLGECYTKYATVANLLENQSSITLSEAHAKKFADLKTAMDRFDEVFAYLMDQNNTAEQKSLVMPLLFALYEQTAALYEELADSDAELSLYAKLYEEDGVTLTLDKRFIAVRKIFVSMTQTSITYNDGTVARISDLYGSAEFSAFMSKVAEVLYAEFKGQTYGGDLAAVMNSFRALSKEDRTAAYMLGVNQLYYSAIARAANGVGAEAAAVVEELIQAEIAYTMGESADFSTHMQKAVALYGGLTDAQKQAFNQSFEGFYTFYVQIYQA